MRQIAIGNSQPGPKRGGDTVPKVAGSGLAELRIYVPRTSICCLGKEGAGGSMGLRESLRELPNTYLVMMVAVVQGSQT